MSRSDRRRELMAAALLRSRELDRRLLIIRPAHESWFDRAFQAWECGAHIRELTESTHVTVDEILESATLRRTGYGPIFADNSSVIFVACLEYTREVRTLLNEIHSIAGHTDNIFVVTMQPWSLAVSLDPRAEWAGLSDGHVVALGKVSKLQRGLVGTLVAGLGLLSVLPPREDITDEAERLLRAMKGQQ